METLCKLKFQKENNPEPQHQESIWAQIEEEDSRVVEGDLSAQEMVEEEVDLLVTIDSVGIDTEVEEEETEETITIMIEEE